MGCHLRGAGGQPLRRRRQRGHDQRRTQGRSTTCPSRTRSARASSSPEPTTTRSSRSPTSRARSPRETRHQQLGRRSRATPAHDVESVEGFTQAIKLLNQGRVDVVVNDSIAVYAYLAETGDKSVKIAGNDRREERAGLRRPQEQRAVARPEQGPRRTAGRRHAGQASREKYLKANASGGPATPAADAYRIDLAADPATALAAGQGGDHQDHPADGHQLRDRPGHRAGRGAGPAVAERDPHQRRPVLHLGHPRHPAAGAAVHRVLRAAASWG